MRKTLLLLLTVLCLTTHKTYSQSSLDSKTLGRVVQTIIDIPELQKYFPLGADASVQQLNIIQHPFSFPADISVTKAGKLVNLVASSDETSFSGDSFFQFRTINSNASGISAMFHYFFKNGGTDYKVITVLVNLDNSGNIINYTLNGDKL